MDGKAKGIWSITEEGTSAYDAFPDSEQFMKQAVALYTKWKKSRPIPSEDEEETATGTALEEAEETAWAEISAYLQEMAPYDFQDLVAGLIEAMGYHVSWVAPPRR